MKTKNQGPNNIRFNIIKSYVLPITAITSFMHRVTGVCMVICTPFLLWAFSFSRRSIEDFYYIKNVLIHSYWWSIILWIFLSSLSYHIFSGIRHIIMELGFTEEISCARVTSFITLSLGIVITIFWGFWIWVI